MYAVAALRSDAGWPLWASAFSMQMALYEQSSSWAAANCSGVRPPIDGSLDARAAVPADCALVTKHTNKDAARAKVKTILVLRIALMRFSSGSWWVAA
jgi:hypothetical protein